MKKNRVKGSLASILSLTPSWIIYCEEKTSGCVVRLTPGEEQVSELGFRSSKACHLPHNPLDRSSSLNQSNEKTAQMAVWPYFQHCLNQNHQVRQHLQSSAIGAWIKCYSPCQFNYIVINF